MNALEEIARDAEAQAQSAMRDDARREADGQEPIHRREIETYMIVAGLAQRAAEVPEPVFFYVI